MSSPGIYRPSPPSMTQFSRSVTVVSNYMSSDAEELTDEELVKKVNELKYQIRVLTIENMVLENTIMRCDPSLMHGIQQAIEIGLRFQASVHNYSSINTKSSNSKFMIESVSNPSRVLISNPSRVLASNPSRVLASNPSKILTSPSKISSRRLDSSARLSSNGIVTSMRINVNERSELVAQEIDVVVNILEKAKKKATKQHALLRAQLEEISIRAADIAKATVAFKQKVIIEGWEKIAQRIPAEVWIRFMNEWVKESDDKIGKLRLRTSTLNTQYAKLKHQIKVKEELSESLRPVDFEKLKIENMVCEEIIENKKKHLKELKRITGDENLKLTIHKNAMITQNNYLSKLYKTIMNKKRLKVHIEKDTKIIGAEAETLERQYDDVKKVRLAFEVPNIMDYVNVKAELTDLLVSVKFLENRVRIQSIALKSFNQIINTASFCN